MSGMAIGLAVSAIAVIIAGFGLIIRYLSSIQYGQGRIDEKLNHVGSESSAAKKTSEDCQKSIAYIKGKIVGIYRELRVINGHRVVKGDRENEE